MCANNNKYVAFPICGEIPQKKGIKISIDLWPLWTLGDFLGADSPTISLAWNTRVGVQVVIMRVIVLYFLPKFEYVSKF
jgi:hypothetical protein